MRNHSPPDPAAEKFQRTVLIVLTVALLVWGAYHAVGSYFGGANLRDDFRRGLVVFGCMAVFLGVWWALLLSRRPRGSRTDRDSN